MQPADLRPVLHADHPSSSGGVKIHSTIRGQISGGVNSTTANSVPETARLTIDARAWTRGGLDRVDTAVRALHPHLPGAALAVEGGINRYPLEPEHAQDLYALARQAARDIGLPPPDAVRSAGASDGNLTAALAIPTLDGLGAVGAHPHARTERVHTHTMPDRAALVAALVDRIVRADHQARQPPPRPPGGSGLLGTR